MITNKPFSTIWYGTKEFLQYHLNELYVRNKVIFYAFVCHRKEEDEKKDHIHVYIVPDGKLDTASLTNLLTEIDVTNPLPIKPLPFEKSKFGDWYLYNTHNTAYLRSKGQSRKYHYSQDDFITSNDDYFSEMIHRIDMSTINRMTSIKKAAESGESFDSLVVNGMIPIQLINQYQKAFYMFRYQAEKQLQETIRNERANHETENLGVDLGEFKNITEKRLSEVFGNNWKKVEDEEQDESI